MADRTADLTRLFEGLSFVSRQSRELGGQLHPELPLMQYSLLSFIDTNPDVRAVDVADAYGLTESTVSRQLARLQQAGLVVRTAERPGRRGYGLGLTDAGRQMLDRAATSSRTTLARHLSGWNDTDIETLSRLLERFTDTSLQARRTDEQTAPTSTPAATRPHPVVG